MLFGILFYLKQSIYTKASKELCQKLVEARERAGLKQKDVENISGILQSELSKMENGQRRVEFLVLVELASLYQVSIDYFIPVEFK